MPDRIGRLERKRSKKMDEKKNFGKVEQGPFLLGFAELEKLMLGEAVYLPGGTSRLVASPDIADWGRVRGVLRLKAESANLEKRIAFLEGERLERIATAAMQGILSGEIPNTIAKVIVGQSVDEDGMTAKMSMVYARALIAELDGEQDDGN